MTRYTWESLWRPQDRKAQVASVEDSNELNLLWGKGPGQIWSDIFPPHVMSSGDNPPRGGACKEHLWESGPSGASCVEGHWGGYTVTWPLRADDKGTGLDDLKGSLQLSDFMIIFLLCCTALKIIHSISHGAGGKKTYWRCILILIEM